MKKLLLLFILFFSTSILTAQTFTPPTIFNNVCDDNNDGIASFYLGEISYEILANLNASYYVVTHHETSVDAATGANPLSSPYVNINPITQTIYVRIVTVATSAVQFFTYQLNVNQTPVVDIQNFTQCDNNNDGISFIDLGSVSEMIWQSTLTDPNTLSLSYFESMTDAQNNTNPVLSGNYINSVPFQQTIYVRAQNTTSECYTVAAVNLYIVNCTTSCASPTTLSVSSVTATSATFSWVSNTGATTWTINITQNGMPTQTITTQNNPYVFTGLDCDSLYQVSVAANCSIGTSLLSGSYSFMTMPCVPSAGQPTNLRRCSDTSVASFDLTANTPLILNTLNPADYAVTYYGSQSNANAAISPIINTTSYSGANGQVIYARVENNTTHVYQILSFGLIVDTVADTAINLNGMDQCDDNNDSSVTFNLTNVQAQINSSNSLAFYTSLANAQNQTAQITNAAAFTIGVQTPVTTIFVREVVPNDCDIIYTFLARTYSVCNLASTCAQANSLCGALGVPFANTHQSASAESGNYYGCLGSQPNPTWFYLPVSAGGLINLMIEQNSSVAFNGTGLDVDYIVYGPFANPVSPCSGQLTQSNVISCSYSTSFTEYPVIANAQTGKYYLIMVTNFSNQPGFIRINELSSSVGQIYCSGLRLNAFLDSNTNGTQDNGEQNFPLGQFTYELNNNGNVHNIVSPTGIYNIYDVNLTNSYDLSYAIDSNYASLYNVSTPTYSNVNPAEGMAVYNFPVTVVQPYNDLAVNIVPIVAPRPGFAYQNKIIYTNNGNQTVASGTLTFNNDALVTITGNSQTGTTPTATGFTYNFTNLLPFETRSMTVTMQVPTIPTVAIGGLLTNTATIAPLTGDVVPANNSASTTQIIIGSYDPNDKMESHGEQILVSSFTSNDYLYYTIRFENSGTASAVNVRVNDVLDSKLDESSIKMVSASHPYILDRLDNNLNWKFDNIQLPVSVANTNTGKGYVMFKVKPRAGYAAGDIIPNTSSIYFDFNPAIVTNTFNTKFVLLLGINEFENSDFVFYPNPVSDIVTVAIKNNGAISNIVVYDLLGKMIVSQKPAGSVSSQTMDLSSISKGMYLIEVTTDSNLKVVKKLIIE